MAKYLLTIRIPLDAIDDPAAREQVKDILENKISSIVKDDSIAVKKLQKLEDGKPPLGVTL